MSKDKLIQKLFEDNDVTSMKLDTPETTPEDLKVDDVDKDSINDTGVTTPDSDGNTIDTEDTSVENEAYFKKVLGKAMNEEWWKPTMSPQYKEYLKKKYGGQKPVETPDPEYTFNDAHDAGNNPQSLYNGQAPVKTPEYKYTFNDAHDAGTAKIIRNQAQKYTAEQNRLKREADMNSADAQSHSQTPIISDYRDAQNNKIPTSTSPAYNNTEGTYTSPVENKDQNPSQNTSPQPEENGVLANIKDSWRKFIQSPEAQKIINSVEGLKNAGSKFIADNPNTVKAVGGAAAAIALYALWRKYKKNKTSNVESKINESLALISKLSYKFRTDKVLTESNEMILDEYILKDSNKLISNCKAICEEALLDKTIPDKFREVFESELKCLKEDSNIPNEKVDGANTANNLFDGFKNLFKGADGASGYISQQGERQRKIEAMAQKEKNENPLDYVKKQNYANSNREDPLAPPAPTPNTEALSDLNNTDTGKSKGGEGGEVANNPGLFASIRDSWKQFLTTPAAQNVIQNVQGLKDRGMQFVADNPNAVKAAGGAAAAIALYSLWRKFRNRNAKRPVTESIDKIIEESLFLTSKLSYTSGILEESKGHKVVKDKQFIKDSEKLTDNAKSVVAYAMKDKNLPKSLKKKIAESMVEVDKKEEVVNENASKKPEVTFNDFKFSNLFHEAIMNFASIKKIANETDADTKLIEESITSLSRFILSETYSMWMDYNKRNKPEPKFVDVKSLIKSKYGIDPITEAKNTIRILDKTLKSPNRNLMLESKYQESLNNEVKSYNSKVVKLMNKYLTEGKTSSAIVSDFINYTKKVQPSFFNEADGGTGTPLNGANPFTCLLMNSQAAINAMRNNPNTPSDVKQKATDLGNKIGDAVKDSQEDTKQHQEQNIDNNSNNIGNVNAALENSNDIVSDLKDSGKDMNMVWRNVQNSIPEVKGKTFSQVQSDFRNGKISMSVMDRVNQNLNSNKNS